jgi:hypothetical protein
MWRKPVNRARCAYNSKKGALRHFEWVVSSYFGSCGMDGKEHSPRRARRTRRMEFDELSKQVTRDWAQDCWSRHMSSAFYRSGGVVNRTGYYTPQVLFVSFVVKPLYASARDTSFSSRPPVALTHYAVSRFRKRYSVTYRTFSYPLETARDQKGGGYALLLGERWQGIFGRS